METYPGMESNTRYHEFSKDEAERYKIKLEDQIETMKHTIENLKEKVVEQRDQLWKEKDENDKMIREQDMFRKQLSMFHLPHCPVLTSSNCPVHSQPHLTSPRGDDKGMPPQQNAGRILHLETADSSEDLFSVNLSSTFHTNYQHDQTNFSPPASASFLDDVTTFALTLADSCQSRLRDSQLRVGANPTPPTFSDAPTYTDRDERYVQQLINAQSTTPSQIFPNL